MIFIRDLSVQFGGMDLFADVTFMIQDNDRIGLTGKNGAGKSTLLKIIAGQVQPEAGEVQIPAGQTIGYLPQDLNTENDNTVFEEAKKAFDHILEIDKRLHEVMDLVTHATDHASKEYHDLLNELHDLSMRHALLGADKMESEIEKVLIGLGFKRTDFSRKTAEFSGGWQMRIELAKILLRKPNLILLDEPTNHLDIESIQWLESFLKQNDGAIVLVSHDRAFLDAVTNRTIEIVKGKIFDYKASYSRYVELRKERNEILLSAQRNQQKEIEHTKELIDKFRAKASKAKFAQSLMKQLDRTEIIELDDDDNSAIYFRFPPVPRSGVIAVEAEHVSKSYGDKKILSDISFQVERGERIAFVGKNGEGKTTLTKMIVGDETYEGKIKLGHNVALGYYAQHQAEKLDSEATVFEVIDKAATGDMRTKVRNLLGSFLFRGDAIYKKVKVLSGGEKSRLSLAHLLLEPTNLLVLDEPTNHLDIRSKDVLKEALMNYEGTLIVVSHDRDFLQGLTNKVYEFRGGHIKEYIGDVYEFLRKRDITNLNELERKTAQVKSAENSKQNEWEEKKQKEKDLKRLSNQISKAEKNIAEMETALTVLEHRLAEPQAVNSKDYSTITTQYQELKRKLDKEIATWSALIEEKGKLE